MPEIIRIHIFHAGEVCVPPALPFGGEQCSLLKAAGLFTKKKDRIWLPVSAYLIEHPKGLFLVDTGWCREMSPDGVFDKKAQIRSLGSRLLYHVNQGVLGPGMAIDEQLAALGIKDGDLDVVLLTHLDCDHANGLRQVRGAKRFLISAEELSFAARHRERYSPCWWEDIPLTAFEWNACDGPAGKSFDLLQDGSVQLILIPGHSDGLVAVKISNRDGKFVLLYSDGGYARKSWEEMIVSGIAADRRAQKQSLAWIREQSLDANCVESLANHDRDVAPHVIEL